MFYFTDPNLIRARSAELAGFYCAAGVISIFSSTLQMWGNAQVQTLVALVDYSMMHCENRLARKLL